MQKGFATLEIILVTIIIAVLVKIAVPNAARIIDTVSLDYEQKRFYSELRYVQAMSRSATFSTAGMGTKELTFTGGNKPEKPTLRINTAENYYQVFRSPELKKALREPHYLSNDVKIFSPENSIYFDSDGKANINTGSIIFTSRLGKSKYIVFDSVGRIKSSLTPPP